MSASGQDEAVVLRDLESLLRNSLGEDVQVLDCATKTLLPMGENYGSTMLKVDALIKRSNKSAPEPLALVAKMVPATEFQKSVMNTTVSFSKEIFVFEKLVDAYRQIEKESGMAEEDLINVLPAYYGGRLSRNKASSKGDEDAALLMENLKIRDYYTVDRMKGLDLEHASLAISELARFHALGVCLKQRKPDLFEETKKFMNVFCFTPENDKFDDSIDHIINNVCVDPRIAKYKDRIVASIKEKNWNVFLEAKMVEPWVSVTHGDFWSNNMMFHKGTDGKPDNIKFIDFQLMSVCSPLKDLPYFLCGSTSPEVLDNHFDELVDIYYDSFIGELKRIGCDATPFSRDNFDRQLKIDGSEELFHCIMAIKFFTFEMPEDFDLNNMMTGVIMASGSDLYLERAWKVVSRFIKQGWL